MSDRRGQPTIRDRIILGTAIPLGLVVVLATRSGNVIGISALPFDQHHVIGQFVGLGLVLWGLMHWK